MGYAECLFLYQIVIYYYYYYHFCWFSLFYFFYPFSIFLVFKFFSRVEKDIYYHLRQHHSGHRLGPHPRIYPVGFLCIKTRQVTFSIEKKNLITKEKFCI